MRDLRNIGKLFLFVVVLGLFLAFCLQFAINVEQEQRELNNPPPDQIAESEHAPPEGDRSGQWPTVRKHHLLKHPECEACGTTEDLNVHHIVPFHERPDLELALTNLVTACRTHHFYICHDPDGPWRVRRPSWKESNPNAVSDMRKWRVMHQK